ERQTVRRCEAREAEAARRADVAAAVSVALRAVRRSIEAGVREARPVPADPFGFRAVVRKAIVVREAGLEVRALRADGAPAVDAGLGTVDLRVVAEAGDATRDVVVAYPRRAVGVLHAGRGVRARGARAAAVDVRLRAVRDVIDARRGDALVRVAIADLRRAV